MGGSPASSAVPPDASSRAEPIRTMIVDDHALFRRGLEMVLDEEGDIELVGQASDGTEAVEKAAESLPDVEDLVRRYPTELAALRAAVVADQAPRRTRKKAAARA